MAKETSISWCDSSLNLMVGCDGCELWTKTIRKCYAGTMIDGDGKRPGFAGGKGWPASFGEPALFLDRLAPALKWEDLSGRDRADKPWLNGLPRIVFLNDMGDTFSAKLPLHWMAPLLPLMADSPHQFLMLTKRPSRAAEFSRRFPFPDNFWIGTSVTSDKTLNRIEQLSRVEGGSVRFVSFEPLWSKIPKEAFRCDRFTWAIFGGESGRLNVTACDTRWIHDGVEDSISAGIHPFVKQLGSNPTYLGDELELEDSHGGDWSEWHEELRVREMPISGRQQMLL